MRYPKGLTLIELIVALALAAGLAVSALTVTVNLRRSQLGWNQTGRGEDRSALRRLLAGDLLHAHEARGVRNGFELRCKAAPDTQTLKIRHLPAVISYRVAYVDGTPWVLRSQQSDAAGDFSELVLSGVEIVQLKSADGADIGRSWRALEDTVAVHVTGAGDQETTYRFQIR